MIQNDIREGKKDNFMTGLISFFLLQELDKHPAFMKDVDFSKPLSSEMEGLMQLKYECEDPKGM